MGEIMCQYDLNGAAQTTDLNDVAEKIRADLHMVDERIQMQKGVEIKPLFFGIKAAVVQFIIPEEDGMQDKLEEFLLSRDGISEIELSFTTRL